jgi:hypothetical protein
MMKAAWVHLIRLHNRARAFTSTRHVLDEGSLDNFSDEEQMLRESGMYLYLFKMMGILNFRQYNGSQLILLGRKSVKWTKVNEWTRQLSRACLSKE